ncbi:MAG: SprT family zinc-dependent metalloprotease [Castellaniella sp.]
MAMPESRPLSLAGIDAAIRWQRSARRRHFGLKVDEHGVCLLAPAWAGRTAALHVLEDHRDWLLKALDRVAQRTQQEDHARALWHTRGLLPYRGVLIQVDFDTPGSPARYSGDSRAPRRGDRLRLPASPAGTVPDLPVAVQDWLRLQARCGLQARLDHFLQISGLSLQGWRLSQARTRWGSCSRHARICLNWRLIHFDQSLIDYVVAHEVAHLAHLDHGPGFWRLVEQLMPGWESARTALRQHNPDRLPLLQA